MIPPDEFHYVVGILAGGQSRRMGEPKALLRSPDGNTLIERTVHVAEHLTPVPDEIVICGQATPIPERLNALRVLPDRIPDAGPLAGLNSLLEHANDRWALLLACDMPLVNTPVLTRLLQNADRNIDAVVYHQEDDASRYHACCALYHPRILPVIVNALQSERRSLQHLLATIRTHVLTPVPSEVRQLANVNTRRQYDEISPARADPDQRQE